MPVVLTAHNTTFGYHGSPIVKTESALIFELGTFNLLLGGNGAGKSTVIRTLAGELPLLTGSLEFGNIDIHTSFKDRIGFVPQRLKVPVIMPLTVLEFVLLGAIRLLPGRVSYPKEIIQKADSLLNAVSLYPLRDVLLRHLSVGQLQRAGIARELLGEPVLLFLDESTAGVDREHQPHIFSLLAERKPNMAVILATHDLHHLSTDVDWVYNIDRGIISRATLGEVQCC